jgi:hypothetical protein
MSYSAGYPAFIASSTNRNLQNNRNGTNRPASAALEPEPNLLPLNRSSISRLERAPPMMGDRVISRNNLFYTDSGNNSHRNYKSGTMTDDEAMILISLRTWSKAVVKQVLATACTNCRLTYRNPYSNEDVLIQTFDELSTAFTQNRDVDQYRRFKYAFHEYLLLHRDWVDRLEKQFMSEQQLSYAPTSSVSHSMSDICYFLTHYKHTLVSNLQTKFKRSLTAEEQFLAGFEVRSLLYISLSIYT